MMRQIDTESERELEQARKSTLKSSWACASNCNDEFVKFDDSINSSSIGSHFNFISLFGSNPRLGTTFSEFAVEGNPNQNSSKVSKKEASCFSIELLLSLSLYDFSDVFHLSDLFLCVFRNHQALLCSTLREPSVYLPVRTGRDGLQVIDAHNCTQGYDDDLEDQVISSSEQTDDKSKGIQRVFSMEELAFRVRERVRKG